VQAHSAQCSPAPIMASWFLAVVATCLQPRMRSGRSCPPHCPLPALSFAGHGVISSVVKYQGATKCAAGAVGEGGGAPG
jgi:hypothetical protein